VAVVHPVDLGGRVLGGRYRLLRPIGAGGSATVYAAEDVRLGRRVAVKVLHPGLAADAVFVRRFHAEAQAAAALNHPNVVAVHDWGRDGADDDPTAVPYLVTELLEGGSLRDLLDTGERLTPSQALAVGLQACRGLHYAHGRGFVHRDVKPANLLFGEDGRLRIADFGLARAFAESSHTEPEGVVLGTVRYLSPEQAAAAPLDGRSDVYSLALVLVECVTGTVPGVGADPAATLRLRAGADVEVDPARFGPLAPALVAAGSADPAVRSSAAQFGQALLRAAEHLPAPAPLRLPGAIGSAAPTAAGDATTVVGVPATGPSVDPDPTTVAPAAARRRRFGPARVAGLGLVLVALLTAAVLVGGVTGRFALLAPSAPVPSFVGRAVADVRAEIAAGETGWELDLVDERSDDAAVGTVLRQSPAPGQRLREGGTLTLVRVVGPTQVAVPPLVGRAVDDPVVVDAFATAGLTLRRVDGFDEAAAPGTILQIDGVGTLVDRGTTVSVTVSVGPKLRELRSYAGATPEEARAELTALGLVVVDVAEASETVPAGRVIRTGPVSGTAVQKGSAVEVVVSSGPPPLTVPDLSGLTGREAEDRLVAAGWTVTAIVGPSGGRVLATDPPAGAQRPKGSPIRIITQQN